jgi:2,3-bisphosphoglycerate-dependent phosphoglycerate mutase
MRKLTALCSLILVLLVAGSWIGKEQVTITTFILVRHAEKASDGTSDPPLTEDGAARAQKLSVIFKEEKIDAIYSTGYKRTRSTVEPLAETKKLEVQIYQPNKPEPITEMLSKHRGGTVVISGHSNTIPWTANFLTGKESIQNFADDDFDNLLIVSVVDIGNATVTWMTY